MSAHHLDLDLPRRPKSPSNKAVGTKERLGFRVKGIGFRGNGRAVGTKEKSEHGKWDLKPYYVDA